MAIKIVYYLMVTLCVGLSTYWTYQGFKTNWPVLALPFAIIIGSLLFIANAMLQRRIVDGGSKAGPFVLLFIGMIFSGASNFNYLYTNFMEKDVKEATLREQFGVFRTDLVTTREKLSSLPDVGAEYDRRAKIDTQLKLMWEQMTDNGRPGCAQRCVEHMNNIEGLLGVKLTDLARPGPQASEPDFKDFYNAYTQMVYQAQDNNPTSVKAQEANGVIALIDDRLQFYGNADDAIRAGAGLEALKDLSATSLEIERKANAALPNDQKVTLVYIDPSLGRLGEIVYSFQNGFVARPNMTATISAVIVAIFIDLIPVMTALLAFRPEDNVLPGQDDDSKSSDSLSEDKSWGEGF